MALKLEFEKGPDAGTAFVLTGEVEARIGRAPGCHIVPTDKAWSGELRVECAEGVFKVANEMDTKILLDGKWLERGKDAVVYHRMTLQPTAETLLRCALVEHRGEGGAVVQVSGRSRAGLSVGKVLQWAVILTCLPAALVLFVLPNATILGEGRSPRQGREQFREVVKGLEGLGDDPVRGRQALGVADQIRDARFYEAWGRPGEAFRRYLRLRAELDGLPRPARDGGRAGEPDPFERARAFVHGRILELSERYKAKIGEAVPSRR
jgi:hypothetical protein